MNSVQFSSVIQLCRTLCDPMNCSMPGPPVHHQLPEFTQTHVHRVEEVLITCHNLDEPQRHYASERSWSKKVTYCMIPLV